MGFDINIPWEKILSRLLPWLDKRRVLLRRRHVFPERDIARLFVWDWNVSCMSQSPFINYGLGLDPTYYSDVRVRFRCSLDGRERDIELPYKEEINFVTAPNARILVNPQSVGQYSMDPKLTRLTEPNLEAYMKAKPKDWDGPVLRMHSLNPHVSAYADVSSYEASLQRATYFDLARTNHSLDFPLKSGAPSLRVADLAAPPTGLRTLEQSQLVNSIGTATLVCMNRPGEGWYYYMKLRRESVGVFENVLGTPSGVVECNEGQTIEELLTYIEGETKRELNEELSGSDAAGQIRRIVPLALTRDLMRGGKPQFFFLIELNPLTDDEIERAFKHSPEGPREFVSSLIASKTRLGRGISPEYVANFIYARQFLLGAAGRPLSPVRLFDE